ncbi:sensor domain-containing diguanylate cyclase [Paenibacillus motobuensis]|uniref:sensor domain-containing diguanylate cyclase n=1 Tax=Paenibacillus TaxID=44249 RepID=UPI0020413E80|nr:MULTISPECIES: sensor domain-containing diguanylate cyclase [Paenibacillus]MCM3040363.1 sensor domain-containing diguanylate cyclase [Paenibacillus lutimineralis]MCM3647467.1 sensor domain-containing diguanylate cyclase [Paenibacillus motobuensis]
MAEQSRSDVTMTFRANSDLPLPLRIEEEDQAEQKNWLERLDINDFDFPYLDSLLLTSYSDWLPQQPSFPDSHQAGWFLANYLGEILISQPLIQIDISDQHMIRNNLREVLEQKGTLSVKDQMGAYVLSPVKTRHNHEVFAVLGCHINNVNESQFPFAEMIVNTAAQHLLACFYKRFEALFVEDLLNAQNQAKREEQRRAMLFQVIQRLSDKIDVDSVLKEVFERIAGMYPDAKVELLMSQDHPSRDPRIRTLQLQGEQDSMCVRAFMDGVMLWEDKQKDDGSSYVEIAVPLIGKQGAYGVLHLFLSDEIEEADLQLIGILGDTAGTAFENAKLYEQSNLLISELRLINELVKRLNQSLRLKEVFKFATEELLSIFKAEYCCISQLDKESDCFEIMSSNFPRIFKEFFPKDYGFNGLVYSTREPIILSDYQAYGKISSKFMEETKSRSLIAAPIIVRGEVNGAIMLAHREERFFSYDNYKLLQILSQHIGLAIANASLHAEVRRMANRDMLTELYARHYLDESVQKHQRKDEGGSLIIVDIDQFKGINDTYGHQIGDKILREVSSIVRSTIRKTDIAARWGGEELAIYLPGADVESGYQIAETIRLRVASETDPKVTVSCGIAEWTRDSEKISVESLFYYADMALYKAKNNGRNQTHIGLNPEL